MYATSVKYENLMEPHSLVDYTMVTPATNGTRASKLDRKKLSQTLIVGNSGEWYSTKY